MMIADSDTYDTREIRTTADLNLAIRQLENRRYELEEDLKNDFHHIAESLRPANILKSAVHEVQESVDLKHNLLKVAIGLGAGYFSRKLVVGKSAGIVKKLLGAVLQYGVTNFVAKKKDWQDNGNEYPKKKSLLKKILSI